VADGKSPPGLPARGVRLEEREITPFRDGREAVKLRLKTTGQVEAAELREFLAEWGREG
jgi:hypothetical protein